MSHIVALGGGGFSMEPDNPLLDQYILALAAKPRPRVCFIGTASGDSQTYIDKFYYAFRRLPCEPTHLALYSPPVGSLRDFVEAQDIFYVGGGSTRNLLVLWREWGLDTLLREAWQAGKALAGISAGAICWFEQGLTDSVATDELHPLTCLGFLPDSCTPHYDGEPNRRPMFHRYIADGRLQDGYAADDSAALHFVGRELAECVCSRPTARVYRVARGADGVVETPLPTRYLN